MALRKKNWHNVFKELSSGGIVLSRLYSSKQDLKKLQAIIENRAKEYPVHAMAPVAQEVFDARALLIQGVSTLLKVFPVLACKFCPEVYIGEKGHLIKTCHGYKRHAKNQVHKWRNGSLKDILVPVETFHTFRRCPKV